MYACRAFEPVRAPSALYATTGTPRPSARLIGASKAALSTTQTAMPSAFALIAALNALIISPTSALVEPLQVYETSSILAASAAPYCVGTKNGLVVTWLMRANFHFGCFGHTAAAEAAASRTEPNAASAPASEGRDSAAPPMARRLSSEARSMFAPSSSPLPASSLTAHTSLSWSERRRH